MVKTLEKHTKQFLSDGLLKHLEQYPYVFNPSIVSHLGCFLMTIRVYDTDTKTIHAHLYTWKEKESFEFLDLTEYFTAITNVDKVADPKLFIMNGVVWGTFNTGYVNTGENKVVLFQLINAKISTYYHCIYNGRSRIEKNWAFFMRDNRIYALYGLKEGIVLKSSKNRTDQGGELRFELTSTSVKKHFKGYTIGTQLLSLDDHCYGLIGHKKLEYRGYDSAGIATLSDGLINEVKSEGRVENLENNFDLKNLSGNIGIGHVRWATHGVPNSINAHPHSSENVSVVHNGIIENSTLLKKYLLSKGHKFKSQTDTEVIVHLITENLKTSELQDAITKTLKQLHGSFALGIIFKDMTDLIIGARRGSPLAVGYGPNENYLGSDSYALKSMTNKITYLEDGEFCFIKKDEVHFFNEDGIKINKKVLELSTDQQNYDKGDFKHFIAKEIEEQHKTLKKGIKE